MVSYPNSVTGNFTATGSVKSATGQLLLGADVSLYRQSADVLQTDDYMVLGASGQCNGDFTALGADPKALTAGTAGGGVAIKEGSNARSGVVTLVAGTATVANTSVTASTRIQLTAQALGTVTAPKALGVTARVAATSFTITSADATDTSVVAWFLVEPA